MTNKEFLKRKCADIDTVLNTEQPKTREQSAAIVGAMAESFTIRTIYYFGSVQGIRVTIIGDKCTQTIPKRGEVYRVFR